MSKALLNTFAEKTLRAQSLVALGLLAVMGISTATLAEDSVDVVPGTNEATSEVAAKIFYQVCVQTAPTFENAEAVLRGLEFNLKTDSGTFFHPDYDLSAQIKTGVAEPQCSLVTIGNGTPSEMAMDYAGVTFARVPEDERANTMIDGMGTGQLRVYHPGLGYLYVDVKNVSGRLVTHAVLQPEK
ncbi:hypothetical protein [Paragemmobacter ruber]|uniref:Uncharacterized protein n=1 Tax=Paragemmobacter ruber TaxID=1985673 RepID=A0ABW9Y207_9RHOB|nr:hypothetical protein [Rhodobacter ruber]NBE06533.1 hypothetical protein [Rhodobacter ruber]